MGGSDFGLARFKWNGGRAPWVVRSAIADGMERAAIFLRRGMKRRLAIPYPPASRPGQSPHKRTGNLQRSVDYWLDRKTLKVWVGPSERAVYGIYLEYGAPRRNLLPRPWMAPEMKSSARKVTNIINRAATIAFNKYARS